MRDLRAKWTNVVALAVAGVIASACATSTGPTVDEIVASHVEARGGRERIQALQSLRVSGTVTGPEGRVARIVREVKRTGLFRLEFTYQGTTSVFAHDGTSGWQVAPMQGQFEPLAMAPEADAASGVDQRDIEGPLVGWQEKGHAVRLAGRETVNGREAFKLEVTLAGGAVRWDYVDVETRLVVRSDFTRLVRGRPVLMMNTFSDFRETSGLVFPHAIETRVEERPQVLKISVETIELDPPIDDSRFRMPR